MRVGTPTDQFLSREFALVQVGIFVATIASGPTADISKLALLAWGLRGPAAAMQALTLFVVVRSFNPWLAAQGALGGTLGWSVPLIISLRLLPLATVQSWRLIAPLWLYAVIAALCSVIASPAISVSLMKAGTLVLIPSGIVFGCQRLSRKETMTCGLWLRTLAAVVVGLSLMTLVRPGIAHLPNSELLNGILNQSQALGAFVAPFAAAGMAQWMLARSTAGTFRLTVWALTLLCTLLTASRTAAIATVMGLALGISGGRTFGGKSNAKEMRRAFAMMIWLAFVLLVVEVSTGRVLSGIARFAHKGTDLSLGEAFEQSRGELISTQLQNFSNSPVFGVGFGVYADGHFPSGVRTFMGIPVSAPVEKGVLPTAVLEETGLLGFAAFAWLVYSLVAGVWRRAPHAVVAMLVACLFVNLGEAILLSPGGFGLHIWLLIGWCLRAAQVSATPATAQAASTAGEPHGAPPRRPYPNLLD